MITCGSCSATNADGIAACAKCGAALSESGAATGVPHALHEEKLAREVEGRQRIRRVRKAHAVVGAATFFLLNLLLGLPMSLSPFRMAGNLVVSCIFGLPIGWIISSWRGGMFRGALISAATFIVIRLILGGFEILNGAKSDGVFISAIIWGTSGVLPGAFIGFHVDQDE